MLLFRTTAKTPDRKKVAAITPVNDEMVRWEQDAEPVIEPEIVPFLAYRSMEAMERTAQCPVELYSVAIAEQMEVTRPLTQEEFDNDPEYAEMAYCVGDLVTEFVTIRSANLDKKLFDLHII